MIASIDEDLNGLYDNALDCLWIVRLSPDKIIIFKLLEMNIRSHTTRCDGDYLEVTFRHFL